MTNFIVGQKTKGLRDEFSFNLKVLLGQDTFVEKL